MATEVSCPNRGIFITLHHNLFYAISLCWVLPFTAKLRIRSASSILTSVRVSSLMNVAIHRVVNGCDVLGITRDWGIGHDWIGIWRFVNRLQLQPLVMDPKIRWLDVLGIAFVFMRPIHRFTSSSFSVKDKKKITYPIFLQELSSMKVSLRRITLPSSTLCDGPWCSLSFDLFFLQITQTR